MKLKLGRFIPAELVAGLFVWTGVNIFGAEFEDTLAKDFAVKPGGKLVVQADMGSLNISPSAGDEVAIRILRKVKASNREKADTVFLDHEVTFKQDGDTVMVAAKNKGSSSHFFNFNRPSLQVSYQISVPKKFNVDLRTTGGDINLGDLDGQATTHTSSGSIVLKAVAGNVEATDSGGDIHLEEGGSDVIANTSSGSIFLKSVKGNVNARTSGGDITIESTGGGAKVTTSSGSIKLGRVRKDVNVRNSGGDITLAEAGGKVEARTSSGSIRLKNVKGSAEVKNSGGDITIEKAEGDVHAETSSGAIKLKQISGKLMAGNSGGDVTVDEVGSDVDVHTSSGSIRIGKAGGTVSARNSGGDIVVKSANRAIQASTSSGTIDVRFAVQPQDSSRLEVAGGGIKLALADGMGAHLNARATGGRVVTELPVTVTVQGEPKEGTLDGKINGGGADLVLRASSGDIVIKK